MPSEINTLQPCRTSCWAKVGQGPYELFHGFCSSILFQSSPHAEANLELQNSSASPKRKKRKSRKHQRVMNHRALLEERKLPRPTEGADESSPPTLVEVANRSAVWEEKSPCCQSNCRCPTNSRSANMFVDKHRLKIVKLKALSEFPPAACDSPDMHQPSINGCDSGLSMPGNSASCRPSSPSLPWTSPGKCIAIDCEMVGTGPGGRVSELARCSVVNYVGDVIYDKYIKPELPIFDYRTRWSGITRRHMRDAIPFQVAQKEVIRLLKDKLVIGHALCHDFRALKYIHPSAQVRDTSKIPLLNQKAGLPLNATVSLKSLAWRLLHKRIQVGREGHSSVEDAFTAMELYRLVQDQCEQDLMTNLCQNLPDDTSLDPSDNEHFMEDKYWPEELKENYT